jgi:uracil DNA glycosylase
MVTKTRLSSQKFEPLLSSWWRHILPFFNQGGLDNVFSYLKSNKEAIYPASKDLWLPFQLCEYTSLKAVIAVQGPYLDEHTTGLALGWREDPYDGIFLPEPLELFYGAIEKEIYGLYLQGMQQGDLSYLAKQGILLLNIPMTGDKKNGPHTEIWKPFIQFLFQETIAYTGVPVIFIGKETWEYEEFLAPWSERFLLEYPKQGWDSKGAFSKVKEILKKNNRIEDLVWMETLPF